MTNTPRIILNNLSFHLENTPLCFERINFSFEKQKYGIVGKNGIGKSTLLKLILGTYIPDGGKIQRCEHILDVPQLHGTFSSSDTIGDVLGITDIINAIHRINNGSVNENDFDIVSDHWDIENRTEEALRKFNLWPIDIATPFNFLSGGQKTKVLLAKTYIFQSDFLIFDEPTNNLDSTSRKILYQYFETLEQGVIVVSHDRTLLNKVDHIIGVLRG